MLSLKAIGAADSDVAAYYEQLAQDDYYQVGFEPAGQWFGELAKDLLLYGDVQKGQLRAMFQGFHPLTNEPLARNAGAQHKAGWDLTFSAPKSVSVLWGIAGIDQRQLFAIAHDEAVRAAMIYLQSRAFSSRDRLGASSVEKLLAAVFQHGSSRELDPQLHSHVLVANLAARGDGTFSAIDFDSRYKMAAGAIYRAEFASRLRQAGYQIERDQKSFRIVGIDKWVCDHFSKRRNQILQSMQATGYIGAKAASIAALATREAKVAVARAGLHEAWREEAAELGFVGVSVTEQNTLGKSEPNDKVDIDSVLRALTESSSTFTIMQLEAALAIEAQGRLDAAEVEKLIEATLVSRIADLSKLGLIELRDSQDQRRPTPRYTTREMRDLETGIVAEAMSRQSEIEHSVDCAWALAAFPTLSDEQRSALKCVTGDVGAVKVVQGMAGSGKSYLLAAAKSCWERAGYSVLGAALAGKAADSLEQGSGIPSQTLHSLLLQLDKGQRKLNSTDVVVLDESGMIGSRQMGRLLSYVHEARAKAVLVGDAMQLQPIDAGTIFRALSERLGSVKLEQIRRQEKSADRQMIHDVISGRTSEVLTGLHERGLLQIHSKNDVFDKMIAMWDELRDIANPSETMMLAGTRAEVYQLNQLARNRLKEQNALRSEITLDTESGERQFAIGDRVVFTRNSKAIGVKNGQTGSLTGWQINERGDIQFTVQADSGRQVSFSSGKYNHLDHGYALSVHKAQGQTLDNALIMLSESMSDREWAYVAASRHRKELRVFADRDQMNMLEPMLNRSRQKDITLDYSAVDRESDIENER